MGVSLTLLSRAALAGKTRSSPATGAASQLATVDQLLLPPAPLQVRVDGVSRSSSASTRGRKGRRPAAGGVLVRSAVQERSQRLKNMAGTPVKNGARESPAAQAGRPARTVHESARTSQTGNQSQG